MTHYVPLWAPVLGLLRSQAICGQYVFPSQDDPMHPTCPTCQRLIAEDDARLLAEHNERDVA